MENTHTKEDVNGTWPTSELILCTVHRIPNKTGHKNFDAITITFYLFGTHLYPSFGDGDNLSVQHSHRGRVPLYFCDCVPVM